MRVVLTGAAGFIGSHLAERYVADGNEVVGLDNLVTGSSENLRSLSNNAAFKFIQHDVSREWSEVEYLPRNADLVLHFASPASPVDYNALPIETMKVNAMGTLQALEFAKQRGAALLFASTSETYGDPLQHPQREEYWGNVNPVGVRSCYDESKRYGEALTMSYYRVHELDLRIIRIFNTYGPRMRRNDGRVVPNFIIQALEKQPLTIYGDGTQTRSFCYIDDLVEGIVRCANASAARGAVVNLGNPEEHSIREFAETVCELVGIDLEIDRREMPPDDPSLRCPDISKAKRLLDWEPRYDLRRGLERTIEFFRARYVGAS